MLVLTRRKGEWLRLLCPGGVEVRLAVASVNGGTVRLAFDAPPEVAIVRDDARRRTPEHRSEKREQP